MEIVFLGVGEACDPAHGNTAFYVTTSNNVSMLCDCGFSIPHRYFSTCDNPDELDLVWISHFHGDHFFGLPLFFLRFWEMGRTKPLVICGQRGTEGKVYEAMELAFPGFTEKLAYDLCFEVIEPEQPRTIAGLSLAAVETVHSQRNLGLLLDDGAKKLYYSGDGRPSEPVANLVAGCDIVIHEAFMLNDEFPFHGSITGCLELFKECSSCAMALVHLERRFRRDQAALIQTYLDRNPSLFLPVPGTILHI